MRLHTIIILFVLISSLKLDAQFERNNCPSQSVCLNGTYSYNTFYTGPGGDMPIEACEAIFSSDNQYILKFQAISNQLDVLVINYQAIGDGHLSAGIVDACDRNRNCIVSVDCNYDGSFVLETSELIPGKDYFIYLNNCLGIMNFDVEMTEGDPVEELPIADIQLQYIDECEYGLDNKFCVSEDLYLNIRDDREETIDEYYSAEGIWVIKLSGPEEITFETESLYDIDLSPFAYGEYELELVSLITACHEFSVNKKTVIELEEPIENFGELVVCTSELITGAWMPSEWEGGELIEAGEYSIEYENSCGCSIIQNMTVIEHVEEITEIELVLCPADYPYYFFDDYIIEYQPYDYELFLSFEGESEVEDFSGLDCDTSFLLTIINERPGERCASCNLPLILENSKIVYCIPFENGSFDVSGKANIVDPQGVRYDNNGPAGNPYWEAVFDGRDDYVRLPHSEDLNTSGFSLDFHFNKDDDYDNGDIETLISKGDEGEDNLRYSIELHKKTDEQFELVAKFFTETTEYQLTIPDMFINTWYGTSFIIEEDSISIYLNGELYDKVFKSGPLKGNIEDVYLGIKQIDAALDQAYGGRMDNFKYWKEKLTDQDILYLYYPEKQFEVNVDLYMSCCEAVDYEGILINAQNPSDTIIYPEASPTGYDSVFFINYVEIESGPQIVNGMQLEDIIVTQMVSCNETCSAEVSWQLPEAQSFSDLCGISEITSSFGANIQLDENISYLEVDYVATNNCGHSTQYSFAAELICEYESFTHLAEDYSFEIEKGLECDDSETYCISNNYSIHPHALIQGLTEEIEVLDYNNLLLTWTLNGVAQSKMIESQTDLDIELVFEEAGFYVICLLSIESACDSRALDYCKTIEVINGSSIDYGSLRACEGSIASVLPTEMKEELQELVVEANDTGSYKISYADDCGCVNEELVQIDLIENEIEMLELEVCEASFPIEIMGELFDNNQIYNGSLLIFRGASEQEDALGESCDSLILLTINVNKEIEVELNAEICEGDSYMGYTESGIYEIAGQTDAGCDSTTIIALQVNAGESYFESVTICEGESYNGYGEPGVYTRVYQTEKGCDSIVQTEVFVNELSILNFFEVICEGEEFMGYNQTGIYEETYIAQNGCDSLVIINLTVLEETHPDCITSSTDEVLANVKVYPNPVKEVLNINPGEHRNLTANIYDSAGRLLLSKRIGSAESIDLSQIAPGLLIVSLSDCMNGASKAFKIIKLD